MENKKNQTFLTMRSIALLLNICIFIYAESTSAQQRTINYVVGKIKIIGQDNIENYIVGVSENNKLYWNSEDVFYKNVEPVTDSSYSGIYDNGTNYLYTKKFIQQEFYINISDSVNAASIITKNVFHLNDTVKDTLAIPFNNTKLICNKDEMDESIPYQAMNNYALYYSLMKSRFENIDLNSSFCFICRESIWLNADNYFFLQISQRNKKTHKLTSNYCVVEFPKGLVIKDTCEMNISKRQYKWLKKKVDKEKIEDSYWRGKVEPYYLETNNHHYLVSFDTEYYTPLWMVCQKLKKIDQKNRKQLGKHWTKDP